MVRRRTDKMSRAMMCIPAFSPNNRTTGRTTWTGNWTPSQTDDPRNIVGSRTEVRRLCWLPPMAICQKGLPMTLSSLPTPVHRTQRILVLLLHKLGCALSKDDGRLATFCFVVSSSYSPKSSAEFTSPEASGSEGGIRSDPPDGMSLVARREELMTEECETY